jgi:hypothetical protein
MAPLAAAVLFTTLSKSQPLAVKPSGELVEREVRCARLGCIAHRDGGTLGSSIAAGRLTSKTGPC